MTASFLAAKILLKRYQAGLKAGTTEARGSTASLFAFNRGKRATKH